MPVMEPEAQAQALSNGVRKRALPPSETHEEKPVSKVTNLKRGVPAPALDTPTDLDDKAVTEISKALNGILADAFALYLKTKNFHWHVSGPHFRDYHLMLDEHADAIFATTDPLAERVRKISGTTLRSIGHIAQLQSIKDNDAPFVGPNEMLRELMNDNKAVAAAMRKAHKLCDDHEDVATASLLEVYIDETERRTWFLFEASRKADATGH
ncbi:MAG: starvation-inducible DNA-binding protein [Hyphomicrobiales bacterium]|jgi:starvation-inducible DNA-binding protein|nr:starvation-inducible DNA-binding protein [Hyphomicrobiales bacterium]